MQSLISRINSGTWQVLCLAWEQLLVQGKWSIGHCMRCDKSYASKEPFFLRLMTSNVAHRIRNDDSNCFAQIPYSYHLARGCFLFYRSFGRLKQARNPLSLILAFFLFAIAKNYVSNVVERQERRRWRPEILRDDRKNVWGDGISLQLPALCVNILLLPMHIYYIIIIGDGQWSSQSTAQYNSILCCMIRRDWTECSSLLAFTGFSVDNISINWSQRPEELKEMPSLVLNWSWALHKPWRLLFYRTHLRCMYVHPDNQSMDFKVNNDIN
jgi:hypothetical protein